MNRSARIHMDAGYNSMTDYFDGVRKPTSMKSYTDPGSEMQDSNKDLSLILKEVLENVSVLQIKVGALETIVLEDNKTRAEYTRLVNEQADVLNRERQNMPFKGTAKKTPRA